MTLKIRVLKYIAIFYICSTLFATSHPLLQANNSTFSLPDLGSSANNILSPSLAEKIGAAYIRQARAQMEFIDDPLLLDYLNTLGNKLVSAAIVDQNQAQKFTFHLVNNPRLNAFAIPGGHIVIHSGLVINTKNEQQLAATLAHEIAHITQHHTARSIENSRYNSAIAIASLLLAAATRSAEAAQTAIIASQGGILQQQLAYSRGFEREADNNAVRTLHRAGYNPSALTEFLTIMNKKQQIAGSKPPEFLLTHPLTNQRISETAQRARSYANKPIDPVAELAFKDFQALIAVEFHEKHADIIKHYQFNTQNLTANDHFKYGMALTKTSDFSKAKKYLNLALAEQPSNINYQIAMTELNIAQQDYQSAITVFEETQENDPENYSSVAIYHANALLISKQHEQAIEALKIAAANNPDEPLIHILLARAYGELDLLSESYIERAQYHYLRGSYAFAIEQLDNALAYTPNPYQKRKLLAKKESFQQEQIETEAALKKL